ncbi:MAG: hypothetical protein HPY74_00655 [Firmicutes bacterium]|nr:hypothetical protein [Bacillota bacterium]
MLHTLGNNFLNLTFDSCINNLVEIRNKITNDNYIKTVPGYPIFSLSCIRKQEGVKEVFVPSAAGVVNMSQDVGTNRAEIYYEGLSSIENSAENSVENSVDIVVKILIELKDDCATQWSIELENRDTKYDIVEVLFPRITGIYLGESWKDDVVIYPHHAGEKTKNPVEEYVTDRYLNFWRANTNIKDGIYYREINYCGLASMMWMYYYDENNGFYISSNDGDFPVTGMRVETGGPKNPWMGFGIRKYLRIKNGEKWRSNPYIIAVNCEDWHWGAKTYRKWIEQYLMFDNNPSYLKNEYALNQCYNFKKDGKVMNRFDKIPNLFDRGMEYGLRHMFIASWNRKGFDCNYAEYYPDMDLGTSMDLYNGCSYVNKNGGFVTFYINARIFDMDSEFFPTLGQEMAIKKEDGDFIVEQYGSPVKFAVMCPSDERWQKLLIDTACWMVKSYGATGIYLDQLGSAEPYPCYNEKHSHGNIGEFNKGYLYVLKTLNEKLKRLNPDSFIMIENCGDIYGSYVWGSLTWNGDPYDEYFNIFKYTFPEYVQVNMVNPRAGLHGEEMVYRFYKDMERALLLGSVMWLGVTYKFDDNAELREYARKALCFRRKLNSFIINRRYADDEGILYMSEGLKCSRWISENENDLFIIGNCNQLARGSIVINMDKKPEKITGEDIEGECIQVDFSFQDNRLSISIPQTRMLYLFI